MPPKCRAAVVVLSAFTIAGMSLEVPTFASNQTNVHGSGFFQRHPKLKKYLIIGGVGAATGGLGAAVLGKSVASGAAMSAGTHIGASEAKEKYQEHKSQKPQKRVQGKVVPTKHEAK